MVEIKRLNATAIGVFTDSEEEANEIMEKYEEDYEGPKGYWYVTSIGEIVYRGFALRKWNSGDEARKEIGNYFETKEEAEKAVEKLKIFNKLKQKGFEFESWFGGSKDISFWLDTEIDEDIAKDLDLLFGGEE